MMRAQDEAALKVASTKIADPAAAAKLAASDAAKTAEAAAAAAKPTPESKTDDLAASLASSSLTETCVGDPRKAKGGAVLPTYTDDSDVSTVVAQVEQNPRCVVDFSLALRDNSDVMAAAVAGDEFLLEYASDRLRDYEPLVLRAVQVHDAPSCPLSFYTSYFLARDILTFFFIMPFLLASVNLRTHNSPFTRPSPSHSFHTRAWVAL